MTGPSGSSTPHTYIVRATFTMTIDNSITVLRESQEIDVYVTNPCLETTIPAITVNDMTSALLGAVRTQTFVALTDTVDSAFELPDGFDTDKCGLKTYSVRYVSDQSEFDFAFLTLSDDGSSSPDVITLTLDPETAIVADSYDVYLKVEMVDYPSISVEIPFTVTINACQPIISAPTLNTLVYAVNGAADTATFDAYQDLADCGYTFEYTATFIPETAPEPVLPDPIGDFVTFNDATRTFSVYTTDSADEGYYRIQITATLVDDPSVTFDDSLEFFIFVGTPDCTPDTVLMNASPSDDDYIFDSGKVTYVFDYSQDLSYCQLDVVFTVTKDGSTYDYDPQLLVFNENSGVLSVEADSNSYFDLDQETLTITVSIESTGSTSSPNTASASFDLTFLSPCWQATYTAPNFVTTVYSWDLY